MDTRRNAAPSEPACLPHNPSRWKDCLVRSFSHGSTNHGGRVERLKLLAVRHPWVIALSCWLCSPGAPLTVQEECRLVWRTVACLPKDQPGSLLRLLEQGPESQSASAISQVVSAFMGTSEVDVHSVFPLDWPWLRSNHALP